jgi:NADH:ubiquinone oxidoreductase subunit 5 (subunit L)/multisubunit Na+/H+ antiporter MnhA subunit
MKLKIGIFTFLFVFLFYMALFIAGFIPFIAEHKQNFSGEIIQDYALDTLLHPVANIQAMHEASNPLLYITLGAALGVFIYLLYKTRHRDYENVGEKYGVQGSSRWAKKVEVKSVKEQITVSPKNQLMNDLKNTLREVK